jgi:soluble lytic murein transglycosylase-like protein
VRVLSSLLLLFVLFCIAAPAAAQIPQRAYTYQRALIGNARFVWGLNAPIATMAAQIHQESAWRPDAQSPYAGGLAQFTPDTADWISMRYSDYLGANQPYEPEWALRALARYDKYLYDRMSFATRECDRWAFTLSGYNGGAGWVNRDRRLATADGKDSTLWWGNVEEYSDRADWAIEENRNYPIRILLDLQPRYLSWGLGISCEPPAPPEPPPAPPTDMPEDAIMPELVKCDLTK